ncbi:BTB and MATH domain-containing protein 38-like [Saccostrea cucullata]|uniref:BTB and MATH domain-containing protein 38-like n=1 Tax=Saccostrea cuccullata TaxID=36930 RepID=UPI002ED40A52
MTDASALRDFTQPDELSDLTLVISGTPLHVHKQYLAEWSPVWRQLFLEECSSPQGLREILMPDKNLQEVTELLHCIYSTQKPISDTNVKFLLQLSDEFQINRVKERCEQFLINQDRSLGILVLAEKYNLRSLYKQCMEYAKTKTLEELDSSPEIKRLSSKTVLQIYHDKIEMLRDYSNDITQRDRRTMLDCETLRMEKANMLRSLQGIQKLWDTPSKRCFRHIADSAFNYSCADCNEKIYFEVRKLCGEGQHLRRYFPKPPEKK